MPSDPYKYDNSKVIGGAARVLASPSTYPLPTQMSEIVNLSTYAPVLTTYGWWDIGTTKSASNIAIAAATNEWRGEQQGPIRTLYTDYSGTASFEMEEMSQVNKQLAGALIASDPAAGQHRTDWTARTVPPKEVHLCFFRVDPDGRLHATIAPRAQWDGSALQRQFSRGESEALAMPHKLYPDPNNLSAVSGDPLISFDLDTD